MTRGEAEQDSRTNFDSAGFKGKVGLRAARLPCESGWAAQEGHADATPQRVSLEALLQGESAPFNWLDGLGYGQAYRANKVRWAAVQCSFPRVCDWGLELAHLPSLPARLRSDSGHRLENGEQRALHGGQEVSSSGPGAR